jgi:hypothetical protein
VDRDLYVRMAWVGVLSAEGACDMISVHEQNASRGRRHLVAIKGEVAASETPPPDN